jgi:DNA-binding MarR family transcriptional regulator
MVIKTSIDRSIYKRSSRTPLGNLLSIITSFDVLQRYLELELMKYDVTPIRFRIMSALYKNNGEMTPSEIARSVFRANNSITAVLNTLIKQGVVYKESSDNDGRSVKIIITEKGWHDAKALNPVAQQLGRKILSCLDQNQIETLTDILRTVRNNLLDELAE